LGLEGNRQQMSSRLSDNLFTGPISGEYDLLKLMCPNHVVLARRVAETIAAYRPEATGLKGFEVGCGTGISTLSLLAARDTVSLTAVDSAAQMLEQARANLAEYVTAGRATFVLSDALTALRAVPDNSLDFVASNYAIHNFLNDYRADVLREAVARLVPHSREAHFNAGGVAIALQRWPDAERHLRAALRLDPGLLDAHFALGNVLAVTARPAEAIPHYETVLQARPDFAEARANLAIVRRAAAPASP